MQSKKWILGFTTTQDIAHDILMNHMTPGIPVNIKPITVNGKSLVRVTCHDQMWFKFTSTYFQNVITHRTQHLLPNDQ